MQAPLHVPALLHRRLTPVYDLFARAFLREERLKTELVARARIGSGHRVLDLGAGTGTLAIMIKRACPDARVTGLDGDPAVLVLARAKASHAEVDIEFDLGDATALPYPDRSFDRVLSSLVLSVLASPQKQRAVREAGRVLRPGGDLFIGDFGPPRTGWARFVAPLVRRFEPIRGNLDGLLPALLLGAGFEDIGEVTRLETLFGTLSIVFGRHPA